jgi:hypothetical protein
MITNRNISPLTSMNLRKACTLAALMALLNSCASDPSQTHAGNLDVGGITSTLSWDAGHRYKVSKPISFAFKPGGQPSGRIQIAMEKCEGNAGALARTAVLFTAPKLGSRSVSGMFILYDADGREIDTGAALIEETVNSGVPVAQFITSWPHLTTAGLEQSSRVEFYLQGKFEEAPSF